MNIEFHYYITCLIAARAGLRGVDLRTLSYASQFVDDNDTVYQLPRYTNRISQTLQPLQSHADRLEVYPLFHFIPGDPDFPGARRKDGTTDPFNTTPDSPNANRIIDAALATRDLHEIGIAAHAYADTWAHQNFVGHKSGFNKFTGFVSSIIPNIGHADAKTKPDQVGLVWHDGRLAEPRVDNTRRFLDAATCLFKKLRGFADRSCSPATLEADCAALLHDLLSAMDGSSQEKRIRLYQALARKREYCGAAIPGYDKTAWFKKAVKQHVSYHMANGRTRQRKVTYSLLPSYARSDWFRFQEAVKRYAERTKAILCENQQIAEEYGVS